MVLKMFFSLHFNKKTDKYFAPVRDTKKSGIFNVCGSTRLSKIDFALKIAKKFKLKEELIVANEVEKVQKPIQRPLDLSLSNKKLITTLGIENIDIQDCIEILKKKNGKEMN